MVIATRARHVILGHRREFMKSIRGYWHGMVYDWRYAITAKTGMRINVTGWLRDGSIRRFGAVGGHIRAETLFGTRRRRC